MPETTTQRRDILYSGRKDAAILLLLVLVSILLRLPFFFIDLIDWDESVFILMGQWLADGNLPYIGIWDIKPPLGFAFFAGVILALGKSLVMIRLAGAIWLGIAAFVIYRVALKLGSPLQAGFAGVFTLAVVSLTISSGQAVMMEHVAMVPLLASLAILMKRSPCKIDYFWAGFLVGAAVLTRLNLAITAVLLVPLIFYIHRGDGVRTAVRMGACYAGGGLTIAVLVFLPYVVSGEAAIFVTSVLRVPLSFSGEGSGFLETLASQSQNALPLDRYFGLGVSAWSRIVVDGDHLFRYCLWLGGLIGTGRLLYSLRDVDQVRKRRILLFAVYFVSLVISIGLSGYPWGHYLIQVVPFFAIGAALVMPAGRGRLSSTLGGVVIILLLCYTGMRNLDLPAWYLSMANRAGTEQGLQFGSSFDIANYLAEHGRTGYSLFSLDNSLVYWLTARVPPTPVSAFPWNISKEEGILKPLYGEDATSAQELERILRGRPDIILLSERTWYRDRPELLDIVVKELEANYVLDQRIAHFRIYARE